MNNPNNFLSILYRLDCFKTSGKHCTVGEKGHFSVTLYFSQKYFYSIPKIFYNIYQIFSKNILLKSSFQFGVKIEVLISFDLIDLLKK